MARKRNKLIYGVGVVDIEYNVTKSELVSGKQKIVWVCPYYDKWTGMLERCYSPSWLKAHSSYVGCSVVDDWKYLSNFIEWVDSQPNRDWENCHLDKDLLICGNKEYSPAACVFVSQRLNKFLTDSAKSRGEFPIGVTFHKRDKIFEAKCCNPLAEHKEDGRYLGRFKSAEEAYKAWRDKKHEYACQLAAMQEDSRVADALRNRFDFVLNE